MQGVHSIQVPTQVTEHDNKKMIAALANESHSLFWH